MSLTSSDRIPGRVWYRTGVAGMASYLDAAAIISTGTALVLYTDPFGLSTGQIGQLSAMLTFLMALGALVGGRLADKFGRKRVFLVTMGIYIVGAASLAFAPSVAFLYAGIVLLGFAVGADLPASLAMIAEEAPPQHRGRLISFSHILWLVGILASMLFGMVVGGMGEMGGRILYLHVLVVAVLTLVLRASMPESHKWQAQHEAAASGAAREMDMGTLKRLVTGPYLLPMLSVAAFYALVNVGANTGGQFTTYMYVELAGSTVSFASAVGLVTFLIAFAATYFLMRIVDGPNRMKWFGVMAIFYSAGYLIPVVFGVNVLPLIVMGVVGSIAGAIAGEPMFKVWAQELIPTTYRSTAQGFMIFFTRVVAALVALWTPTLLEASPNVLFLFVAACIAVGGLLGVFVINRFPRVADTEDDLDAIEGSAEPEAVEAR
ncbi:MFS transporter [Demequina sp. SYSU T00192]|uniref:MFS transporter n=1 Tax=Demequina litoralis TaxID=3051660 RepID=A0ABT8G6F1_9MICO|nr:MFS transporter [Demequina sp. SYSU T00192]MDN4474719.1 MFS transporter [Demequina sp. SYSU T00192]